MRTLTTLQRGYEAVARNLREFGYPDVTAGMVAEIHDAMKSGKELPHGVIGMFAKSQMEERPDIFGGAE